MGAKHIRFVSNAQLNAKAAPHQAYESSSFVSIRVIQSGIAVNFVERAVLMIEKRLRLD